MTHVYSASPLGAWTRTPAPAPAGYEALWATGIAVGNVASIAGVSLSGVPGEPFALGPGGSTIQYGFGLWPAARAAVAALPPERRPAFLSIEARVLGKDPNHAPPYTDGVAVGFYASGATPDDHPQPLMGAGAYWHYTDGPIHQDTFEAAGAINLATLTPTWRRFTIPVPGAVDWSRPLIVILLAEQSSEPQAVAWTAQFRAMSLAVEVI